MHTQSPGRSSGFRSALALLSLSLFVAACCWWKRRPAPEPSRPAAADRESVLPDLREPALRSPLLGRRPAHIEAPLAARPEKGPRTGAE